MSTNIAVFLKRSFLFNSLSEKELKTISGFCSLKKLFKNQTLFLEGDPAQAFFMVVSGKIKIFKLSGEGKEYIIHIHREGDIIAEAAIFDKKSFPANCNAVDDSLVVSIPKTDFINLINTSPSIAIKFMSAYSKRLREFVSVIEELSGSDVRKRFARYIINNLDKNSSKPIVKLSISKKELAAMLGTVPETISRTIAILKKQGIIDTKNKDIVITNINKLKAFTQN